MPAILVLIALLLSRLSLHIYLKIQKPGSGSSAKHAPSLGSSHPNICTLFDVGHQDGIDFLVMEFLEGEHLGNRLLKGPLATEKLLKYGPEICAGLESAHRSGVVHRDLKPSNIMLTKTGVKLMDFGLAKSAQSPAPQPSSLTASLNASDDQPLTAEGTLVGTFQYMSRSRLKARKQTHAATSLHSVPCFMKWPPASELSRARQPRA